MTRILVWPDKHGTSYWKASTDEELQESSRKILKILTSQYGYIQDPGTEINEWQLSRLDMDLVNMPESDYASLPQKLRDPIEKEKYKYLRLIKELERDQAEYKTACALANGEVVEEKWRRRDKYDDEQWQKIVERWPDRPIRGGWMYRVVTPWDFLYSRSDYEYEGYSLEDVE